MTSCARVPHFAASKSPTARPRFDSQLLRISGHAASSVLHRAPTPRNCFALGITLGYGHPPPASTRKKSTTS